MIRGGKFAHACSEASNRVDSLMRRSRSNDVIQFLSLRDKLDGNVADISLARYLTCASPGCNVRKSTETLSETLRLQRRFK